MNPEIKAEVEAKMDAFLEKILAPEAIRSHIRKATDEGRRRPMRESSGRVVWRPPDERAVESISREIERIRERFGDRFALEEMTRIGELVRKR